MAALPTADEAAALTAAVFVPLDLSAPAAAALPAALIVLTTAGDDDDEDVLAPEPNAFAMAATPVGPLGLTGAALVFAGVVATPEAALATLVPAEATDDLVELDEDAAAPAAFVATLPSDILSSKYHVLKNAGLLAGARKNAVLFLRQNYLVGMISSSRNTCDYAG